jgi:hypothetical protein
MTINELDTSLACYFDGVSYDIGSNPVVVIAGSVSKLTEITMGSTNNI